MQQDTILQPSAIHSFLDPDTACALEDLHFDRDELELELYTLPESRDSEAEELNARILELDKVEEKLVKAGAP
jgi:hypothetical protein